MYKDVPSKATYPLRVHQFTTQKVGKGNKGMNFHSLHEIQSWVCQICLFRGKLIPKYQVTTQQVGKGGKKNEFSFITQNPILSMNMFTEWQLTTV